MEKELRDAVADAIDMARDMTGTLSADNLRFQLSRDEAIENCAVALRPFLKSEN